MRLHEGRRKHDASRESFAETLVAYLVMRMNIFVRLERSAQPCLFDPAEKQHAYVASGSLITEHQLHVFQEAAVGCGATDGAPSWWLSRSRHCPTHREYRSLSPAHRRASHSCEVHRFPTVTSISQVIRDFRSSCRAECSARFAGVPYGRCRLDGRRGRSAHPVRQLITATGRVFASSCRSWILSDGRSRRQPEGQRRSGAEAAVQAWPG